MFNCPVFMISSMMLLVILFILSLVFPLLHVLFIDHGQKRFNIQEVMVKYSLFFNVGCLFLVGFLGHILYPYEIADLLHWNWSPFQYELSVSELALSCLGLLSGVFCHNFWLSTIICSSVWLLGVSAIQLYYEFAYNNNIIANGAFVVYWNIFIAFWLIGLFVSYKIAKSKQY